MHYCDNGNTTIIRKEFTHYNKCKMGFYCIFNKILYRVLIHVAFCLINNVIYRTVFPFLVDGAISYFIADSGVTYNTQKKRCCYILPGIPIKHMTNKETTCTVQMYNSSKGTWQLRIHSIKETRFCRANQKLSILNNCWLYMIIQNKLRMKWFEIKWLSIILRWAKKISKWRY